MFLTPNGRFQINKKICLTVTGFHPEHWQPAWGVRTMLIALRDHFGTEDHSAIGYLYLPSETRQRLAIESHAFVCSTCGYQQTPPEPVSEPAPEAPREDPQDLGQLEQMQPQSQGPALFLFAGLTVFVAAFIWAMLTVD